MTEATAHQDLEATDETIDTTDGPMPAKVAVPHGNPNGAVIVVQEAFGLTGHIAEVTGALRCRLASRPWLAGSRVIYGGSAGPGLLGSLRGSVDGLFLGRFAHDPAALEAILDEAAQAAPARNH